MKSDQTLLGAMHATSPRGIVKDTYIFFISLIATIQHDAKVNTLNTYLVYKVDAKHITIPRINKQK